MRIHVGCGMNVLDGFVNIDNSPTVLLSRLPLPLLRLLKTAGIVNAAQWNFSQNLKHGGKKLVYANCLRLPFPDGSVDYCYTSHMLGWCLSHNQIHAFLKELHRVLKPGGALRLSFFDFDLLVEEYRQQRDTIRFSEQMPMGIREFNFRDKLKFLFSSNMQNGLILNRETISRLLEQYGFRDITVLSAGETTFTPEQIGATDLFQRQGESVYIECATL